MKTENNKIVPENAENGGTAPEQSKLRDRAQRYSALLCTAIDLFGSSYDGQKFFDAKAARKWILASLPRNFYSRREKLIMEELLSDKLYTSEAYILDCKALKEHFMDLDFICRELPDVEKRIETQLADISEEKEKELQLEEVRRMLGKPMMTKKKIPHYRYQESSFCNGNCMSANYVHDYDEYIDVLE